MWTLRWTKFSCVASIWSDILQCDKLWTRSCQLCPVLDLSFQCCARNGINWKSPKFTIEGMCWPITKMSRIKNRKPGEPVTVIGAVTYQDRNRAHQRLYKRQIKFSENVELVPRILSARDIRRVVDKKKDAYWIVSKLDRENGTIRKNKEKNRSGCLWPCIGDTITLTDLACFRSLIGHSKLHDCLFQLLDHDHPLPVSCSLLLWHGRRVQDQHDTHYF